MENKEHRLDRHSADILQAQNKTKSYFMHMHMLIAWCVPGLNAPWDDKNRLRCSRRVAGQSARWKGARGPPLTTHLIRLGDSGPPLCKYHPRHQKGRQLAWVNDYDMKGTADDVSTTLTSTRTQPFFVYLRPSPGPYSCQCVFVWLTLSSVLVSMSLCGCLSLSNSVLDSLCDTLWLSVGLVYEALVSLCVSLFGCLTVHHHLGDSSASLSVCGTVCECVRVCVCVCGREGGGDPIFLSTLCQHEA